jgi:glycosyltransferase involved in cell wall biosynthesis
VYRRLERWAATLATRIITVSEFDRDLAIREGVVPDHHVVTIHNGVPDIEPELRASTTQTPARLIMIARFEQQKDHRTLLESLAGLSDLPWHLDLIGEGPFLPAARELSERRGLRSRVQFWGARRDVAHRLAQAQVFMLISNWEGFPRSILEAMRAGLPVVASDVGGVRESVEQEQTGFLVPRGNVEVLRTALRRLLTDPELRDRLGREGRRRYEERFRFELTSARTVAIYRDVLLQCGRTETGLSETHPTFGDGGAVAAKIPSTD